MLCETASSLDGALCRLRDPCELPNRICQTLAIIPDRYDRSGLLCMPFLVNAQTRHVVREKRFVDTDQHKV